jgi:hypothetical protein
MTTKWVGYVDDWCFGITKKPKAHIVTAEFTETPKRWTLVGGQTNWDHVQRACGFRSHFNKSEKPAIFDSWQEAYDYLLRLHTHEVERAKDMLAKAENNLQAAIKAEKPELPGC